MPTWLRYGAVQVPLFIQYPGTPQLFKKAMWCAKILDEGWHLYDTILRSVAKLSSQIGSYGNISLLTAVQGCLRLS